MYYQKIKDAEKRKLVNDQYKFNSVTKIGKVLLETEHSQPLKIGDHIYIFLDEPIIHEHHGIYVGNNRVIHFQNWIIDSSLKLFAHGQVVRVARP